MHCFCGLISVMLLSAEVSEKANRRLQMYHLKKNNLYSLTSLENMMTDAFLFHAEVQSMH